MCNCQAASCVTELSHFTPKSRVFHSSSSVPRSSPWISLWAISGCSTQQSLRHPALVGLCYTGAPIPLVNGTSSCTFRRPHFKLWGTRDNLALLSVALGTWLYFPKPQIPHLYLSVPTRLSWGLSAHVKCLAPCLMYSKQSYTLVLYVFYCIVFHLLYLAEFSKSIPAASTACRRYRDEWEETSLTIKKLPN